MAMKLLIAWLFVMASFTVLVDSVSIKSDDYAYLGDEEELERAIPLNEQEFGVVDLKEKMKSQPEDASCTNLSLSICKPFTKSKILGVLEQLGVTQDPAIRIANVSESFLIKLKENNGTLKATQRKRRSSSNNGMCGENAVVNAFQLIHPYVNLMYVVSGVQCTSNFCFSPNCAPADNAIGECGLKEGRVNLHLFNADGALYSKTVKVGAACKCYPFS